MTDAEVAELRGYLKAALALLPAEPPPPPPRPRVPLGLNLTGVAEWGTEYPFRDAFKQSRPLYSQVIGMEFNAGVRVGLETDAYGYPTKLKPNQFAEALLFLESQGLWPTGEYTLSWAGQGTLEVPGYGVFTTSGAKLNIKDNSAFAIAVRVTKTTAGDHVRNITLTRPEGDYNVPTFRPSFLDRWHDFKVFRYMDWQKTNASPVKTWADRAVPSLVSQCTPKGVALEYCLEHAGLTGADPWLCIPHLADDNYVRQMAGLARTRLPAGRRLYLEYSNECWNNAPEFTQSWYCEQQGWAAGLSANPYEAQLRWYTVRAAQCFSIFQEFFRPAELVRVLSAHAADPWTGATVLNYVNGNVDAIAVAPYFGHGDQFTAEEVADPSLDWLFKKVDLLIERNVEPLAKFSNMAKVAGVQLFAYEGGQHMYAPGDAARTKVFHQANRDPRMRAAYLKDLRQWAALDGGLFCVFSSMGKYTQAGAFGLLESEVQNPATAPKLQAVLEFMEKG